MMPASDNLVHGLRVTIMAGGTGGHVFPALAVAEDLRRQGAEVSWLGTRKGIEAYLVPDQGIPIDFITVRPLRGTGAKGAWHSFARLAQALWESLRALRRSRAEVVLGLGGFASGPGGVAAWLLRIPLLVHEQNAIPGTTNRILARLATRVLEAFPGTFEPERRAIQTGNPVREEITRLPVPELRFGRRRGPVRLLVIGGSQGAQVLNEIVPLALARLAPESRPNVWHQTGRGNELTARRHYEEAGVSARLEPFLDDMAEAYGWADLAICRAGAMTIAELTAAGLGGILVPYPHAVDDHQTQNALFLSEAGATVTVQQTDLTAESLEVMLSELFSAGRKKFLKMAKAARQMAQPRAAAVVARICVEVSRG